MPHSAARTPLQRTGLFASLEASCDDTLHQFKLAELLSRLLSLLDWKLGQAAQPPNPTTRATILPPLWILCPPPLRQGPPTSRQHFWTAYSICEAMIYDVVATREAAALCLRQLRPFVFEFEMVHVVRLPYARVSGSFPQCTLTAW